MADMPENKFDISTSWGDTSPTLTKGDTEAGDFSEDSSGVRNPDQGEKSNLNMGLEPNKFPRETGHDSLTEEEAYLS
jgi:hypothetical protein